MVRGTKAQSGAAILVGLIAVLIILYVLFLPPQERAKLLGDGNTGTIPGGATGGTNTLFSSTVGPVYVPVAPQVRHDLPTVGVRAVEQGSILLSRDTVLASNNAFEKQPTTIYFSAKPDQTRNAVLSMNIASKTGGNVIVTLNGQEIFNQQVQTRTISPLTLTNLQQDNNLTFSASSVGFAFWQTNRYTLQQVKVTADVTDLSAASSTQSFSVAPEEYSSLQSAVLSFVPTCDKQGSITIELNGMNIFSGMPDCDNLNTLEIAPSKLLPGENRITFSTTEAAVVIDSPGVTTSAQQRSNRAFNFVVQPASAQGKQVILRVLFPDSADHRGVIRLNGNTIPLHAPDVIEIPITSYVRAGANSLSFEATSQDFEIVKFDVLIQ